MTRTLVIALLVALAAAIGGCGTDRADAAPKNPRLASVKDWSFAIGEGSLSGDAVTRLSAYDLVVIDGEEASPELVGALRARGTVVLAYVSVGTIEPGRPWYGKVKPYRLELWEDWDEWFADVNKAGFRTVLLGVTSGMLAKGFDGLFLDNTAILDEFPKQAKGMRKLVAALSGQVKARGGLLFTQNGADVIKPMLRYYDGWNRESTTWTYSFDRKRYRREPKDERTWSSEELRAMTKAGLLALSTDYVKAGDAKATAESLERACAAGAVPYVSDIELTRFPATPFRCG